MNASAGVFSSGSGGGVFVYYLYADVFFFSFLFFSFDANSRRQALTNPARLAEEWPSIVPKAVLW